GLSGTMIARQPMKHWWGWLGLGVVALAIGVGGCGMGHPKREAPPPLADEDRLDWAAEEPYFVVVRTSCRTLDVLRYGDRNRSFPAVFGMGGLSGKLHEGDRRTPTGLYAIVDQWPHPRWRRFLLLDYPNLHDAERYADALSSGTIPML